MCEENNIKLIKKKKRIKGQDYIILKDMKLRAHAPQSLDSCTNVDKQKRKHENIFEKICHFSLPIFSLNVKATFSCIPHSITPLLCVFNFF